MIRLIILRFLETFYRHRWLYLLPMIIMLAAGLISIAIQKPEYIARGNIYVQKESLLSSMNSVLNNNTFTWLTPAQTTANEMNELIRTDAFIRAVIHNTDLEEKMSQVDIAIEDIISETRDNIWVTTLGDNQVQINATSEKPQITEQAVNAVIESYIQWKINGQRAESESAQSFFNDQIQKYQVDLDNARQNMKNFLQTNPSPLQGDRPDIEKMEMSRLQKEIDMTESRFTSALDKEESARLALAQIESDTRQSYTIIDAPQLPTKPEISKTDLAIQLAIFVTIGIILVIAAVAGGMLLDRSLNLPLDVQYGLSLPILAVVPDTEEYLDWAQKLRQWFKARQEEKSMKQQEVLGQIVMDDRAASDEAHAIEKKVKLITDKNKIEA